MGVTPIYGFPYPALTDSPNGPAQIQALAEAVETDLATTDANIANLAALGNTYTRVIGGVRRVTAGSFTSGSNEIEVMATPSLSLPASSSFLVSSMVVLATSQPGDDYAVRVRDTNVLGTLRQEIVAPRTDNAVPYTQTASFVYTTTTAQSKVFVTTLQRIFFAGAGGTAQCAATSYIIVSYLGSSTVLLTV